MPETDDVEAVLDELRRIGDGQRFADMFSQPSAAIIERHIEAQAEEIERLRKFAREVLYDYLEIDKQSQCPWCLWVPGRSWEPIHECSAIEMVQVVGTRAAGEAKP